MAAASGSSSTKPSPVVLVRSGEHLNGLADVLEGTGRRVRRVATADFDFKVPLQVVLPRLHLHNDLFDSRSALLVRQPQASGHPTQAARIDLTSEWLQRRYPADHPVTLIRTSGLPTYRTEHDTVPLADLARAYGDGICDASLFVPPLAA